MDRESRVSEGEEYIYGRRVNCTNYTYVPGMECCFVPTAEVTTALTASMLRNINKMESHLLLLRSRTNIKKKDAQTQTRSSENWTSPDTVDSQVVTLTDEELCELDAEREQNNQLFDLLMQTSPTVAKSDILSARISLENLIGNSLTSQAKSIVPLPSCATSPEANEEQQKTAEKLPYVEPDNKSSCFKSNWLEQTMQKWNAKRERFDREIEQAKKDCMIARGNTRDHEELYYGLNG